MRLVSQNFKKDCTSSLLIYLINFIFCSQIEEWKQNTSVIVSRMTKLLFGTLRINLYYVKLSAKRSIQVASMSIFLILNQTVDTLTKVADESNLHKGGTINLK